MHLKVKSLQDFWTGLIFIGIGIAAIYMSRDYTMGTAQRMGPGFFPTWLGGIMAGLGVVITVLSFKLEMEYPEDAEVPWGLRPWLMLSGAFVVFGLMIMYGVGFVPSLMTLIIGCSLAHKDTRWWELAVFSVFLTAASVALFVYGLGLNYRLFWWSD